MKRKQTPQAKVCELERKLLMPWGSFFPCTAGKFFVTREFASKWVGTTETSGPPNFFFVFALVSTVLRFSFSHLHPPTTILHPPQSGLWWSRAAYQSGTAFSCHHHLFANGADIIITANMLAQESKHFLKP